MSEAGLAAIASLETSDLAVSRQDHARLCRRARDLGGQHGHRLSRLRAGLRRRRVLPQQRVGSRSGAQYRPRADLLPGAGALLCRDRQGRRRQGGAGGRSQPEGRHRPVDEGHRESGAARSDHAPGAGIPRLHQDLRRDPQGQARQRAGRRRISSRAAATCCATSSTISPATPTMRSCRRSSSAPRRSPTSFRRSTALANTFVVNADQAVATSAMARLKFVENSLHAISSTDEKIVQPASRRPSSAARGIPAGARPS